MSTAGEKDREILLTRVVNAPREKVWLVWTDADHVAKWWGPAGFTNTVYAMDLRPGGIWRYTMHGPDGTDYVNIVKYIEIIAPERLVYLHSGDEDWTLDAFHVTVTFEDLGAQTRVNMRHLMTSPEVLAQYVELGAVEGGVSHLDCLEAYLATL